VSYDDYEHSRSAQEIVELYLFRLGPDPGAYLAYTDAEQPVSFDPGDDEGEIVFEPLPIQRTNVEAKARLGRHSMTVEVPKDSPLGRRFSLFPPTNVVTLRVWSGHAPHPDAPPLWANGAQFAATWAGRVMEFVRTGGTIKFTCEPSGAAMKRPGLRRNYQRTCPHILYGPGCRASKAAATVAAVVQSVLAPNRIALVPGWNTTGFPVVKFTGGLVEWTGEFGTEVRMILSTRTDDEIVMSGPALTLAATSPVSVILGCGHNLDDCENVHNNVVNYGGHPWIPTKNPVGKNNHG